MGPSLVRLGLGWCLLRLGRARRQAVMTRAARRFVDGGHHWDCAWLRVGGGDGAGSGMGAEATGSPAVLGFQRVGAGGKGFV